MLVTRKQWPYIALFKLKPGTFVFDIHCGPFIYVIPPLINPLLGTIFMLG